MRFIVHAAVPRIRARGVVGTSLVVGFCLLVSPLLLRFDITSFTSDFAEAPNTVITMARTEDELTRMGTPHEHLLAVSGWHMVNQTSER